MKTYITREDMWLNGLFVEAKSEVTLSDRAAKYLDHVLDVKPEPVVIEAKVEIKEVAEEVAPKVVVETAGSKKRKDA